MGEEQRASQTCLWVVLGSLPKLGEFNIFPLVFNPKIEMMTIFSPMVAAALA